MLCFRANNFSENLLWEKIAPQSSLRLQSSMKIQRCRICASGLENPDLSDQFFFLQSWLCFCASVLFVIIVGKFHFFYGHQIHTLINWVDWYLFLCSNHYQEVKDYVGFSLKPLIPLISLLFDNCLSNFTLFLSFWQTLIAIFS